MPIKKKKNNRKELLKTKLRKKKKRQKPAFYAKLLKVSQNSLPHQTILN